MHIGPSVPEQQTFTLGIQPLSTVVCYKDLGISRSITNKLSFSTHKNTIAHSANQRVNLIFRSFISRDVVLLVRAFTVYVDSSGD